MRFRTALMLLLGSASIAVFASGCGSSTQAQAAFSTVPVKGKVLLKGKPLTSGTVKFEPDAGRTAYGEIGPDGTFTLGTFSTNDGAVGGTHRVAVTGKGVPIQYRNVSSSEIEVEVVAGKTDYSITLP